MKRSRMLVIAAALVSLLLVPAASAGQGGTERPFHATVAGSVHFEFPGVSPSNCQVVTTLSEATGEVTHLGRVTLSMSHCPAMPDYIWDGQMTFVAANGDKLYGVYDYGWETPSSYPFPVMFTGGTGRFANATGTARLSFEITGANADGSVLQANWWVTGTISY